MVTNFQRFIADALATNSWTPDVPRIESQDHWGVFIYNEKGLKGRFSSFFDHFNQDTTYCGIGWTNSAIYSILNIEKGDQHFQLASPSGTDRILGEVWTVTPEDLMELDCEQRNLMYTRRTLVPIYMSRGKTLDAWIYTVDSKFICSGGIKVSKFNKYSYYGDYKLLDIEQR